MKVSRALVAISVLSLIACNGAKKDSASKAANAAPAGSENAIVSTSIPDDLTIPPQELLPELTKEQVRSIKARFTSKAQIQMPPMDLVFDYKKMDPYLREARENEIKMRDKNEYDLMIEMRQLCKQSHYEAKSEAVIPPRVEEVERGDRMSTKLSAGVTNDRCPVIGSANVDYSISADRVEQNEIEGSANMKTGAGITVQSERFARLLNGRGILVNFEVGGAAIAARQENAKPRQALISYGINGQYTGLDYVAPFKQKITGLLKQDAKIQALLNLQVTFPEAKINIAVLAEGKANSEFKVIKAFLNGRETDINNIVDLIGNSQIQHSQKTVIGNLQ